MSRTTSFATLLTGRGLVESPRWLDDRLYFSDWGTGEVIAVDATGTSEVVGRVPTPAAPFCLDRLPDGRLLMVNGQQLQVRDPGGTWTPFADLTGLEGQYGYNDIVVDGRGNIYVNNIDFEYGTEFKPGFVALVTATGAVSRVAEGLAFPNGMAVTPDSQTLIVAESYAGVLTAYDIAPDGSLSERRVWADLAGAAPDGICLDAEGAVWFAEVPGQRCVRVAEGGQVREEIPSDLACFSCALGGPIGTTLYVTAAGWPEALTPGSRSGRILTAEVEVPGAGWPGRG